MSKTVIPEQYKPRIIDDELEDCLKTFGAIQITGPKWCGKSWTASYHSNSEFLLQSANDNFNNSQLADMSPSLVLEGETPRLIDEWQDVPKLWDAVRYAVDSRGAKGQFILTGSSSPKNIKLMHSGAGRIERLKMRTMSLYETGDSDGSVSLQELCNGHINEHLAENMTLEKLAHFIVRGGWPGNQDEYANVARMPKSYVNAILDWDTKNTDGIRYNKHNLSLLLKSLARNESTTATLKTLQRDIIGDPEYRGKGTSDSEIATSTISQYLDFLNRLYVTENMPPFAINMRSPARVKQAEKLHFCDTSLPCAIMEATPLKLINDLNTFGYLFEALCEHDLRIYAESFGASLYHYQDHANHELDAVIDLPDGRWCAFEIKLGTNHIPAAVDNLLNVSAYIESHEGKKPSELCVICGMSGAAYRLNNGVFVVPITALKP